MKRLEHFWKGMSSPSSQISPIPPEAYGERFINFITGITMTKEEAERRKTLDGDHKEPVDAHNVMHHHHIPPAPINTSLDGAKSHEQQSPISPMFNDSRNVEKTMRKAQKQADKSTGSKSRRESEEELPDRTLTSITVPEGEPREHRNSTTLPVVQEVGEGSSDISRSGSREKPEPSIVKNAGIRQVSASTYGGRKSDEADKLDFASPKSQQDDFYSPQEYPDEYRSVVNNAFPRVASPESYLSESQRSEKREKPPRLGSGLIPHLAPMYASFDLLDPEKNEVDNGRIDGDVLPPRPLGLGIGNNAHQAANI